MSVSRFGRVGAAVLGGTLLVALAWRRFGTVAIVLLVLGGADCSKKSYHCTENTFGCECVPQGTRPGELKECVKTYRCCVEWRHQVVLADDPDHGEGCHCFNPKPRQTCGSYSLGGPESRVEVVGRPKSCPAWSLF